MATPITSTAPTDVTAWRSHLTTEARLRYDWRSAFAD